MKKFSKTMMAQCAQILKFLVPYTEKFSDPSYKMPDDALDQLQKKIQGLVKEFLESPANVRQEFRAIADDVESLRRLGDLIQKSREGAISVDLKSEIATVKKRLTSIKVILNRDLGMAPRQGYSCVLPLIVLVVLALAGWFFRGTIMKFVPFLGKSAEVQTTQDPDADAGEDADEEGDEAEPAAPSEPEVKQDAEPETPAADAQDKTEKSSKASANKKPKKIGKNAPYRTWVFLDGRKLRARLVKLDGGDKVVLEYKDGRKLVQMPYAIRIFSEKDQEYIQEFLE